MLQLALLLPGSALPPHRCWSSHFRHTLRGRLLSCFTLAAKFFYSCPNPSLPRDSDSALTPPHHPCSSRYTVGCRLPLSYEEVVAIPPPLSIWNARCAECVGLDHQRPTGDREHTTSGGDLTPSNFRRRFAGLGEQ